ncbi:MAG: hypothetical protein NPIRA02_17900 [Nitrospirales bacterium]|nr:MAG: hypothetical protein NPIRA02_17900 [Nitrospirales bacterium]
MDTTYESMAKWAVTMMGVLMIVSIVGSGAANAETKTTTYPGTMCQPYNSTAADNVRYTTQGVYNNSMAQTSTVKCPIPYTLSGGKLSYVIVDVKDQSDARTISCTAYVRGLDGDYVTSNSANSDEFFGGNSDVFIDGISYTDGGGIYGVSCNLPSRLAGVPAFQVVSYSAYESND